MKFLLVVPAIAGGLAAQMSVSMTSSAGSTAPLGTPVTWTATVSGASAGTLFYRFQTGPSNGSLRTVVDYGPKTALTWSTIEQEGSYQVEVSVQNLTTGELASANAKIAFTSLVTGTAPVVTPSANPAVYIYSAPPCDRGSMWVQFQTTDGFVQSTPPKSCLAGSSMNFYLAGMRPQAAYTIQHTLEANRATVSGPVVNLTPATVPTAGLPGTLLSPAASRPGLLLQSLFGEPSIATDLEGNQVWASPGDITYLTRPITGGTFLGVGEDGTKPPAQQFFREFDLAGIPVAETNAAWVSQQLATLGIHAINGFHHEARKLPDGGYLVLADSERMLTNVQGPGTVDVIGDTIVVLNQNLQVTWAWDAFDHLDTYRMASLGETCTYPAGQTCAPFYLSPTANDWLHGNALQLTPDGQILYSTRHQDWVIKIDYANGAGSGAILWRMGMAGDFQMQSSGLDPWFSHQHDPNFESNNKTLLVFDDGNVRQASNPAAHSRGQALEVDETNMVVTTVLNADLGVYSGALGTAEVLPNGDYHFDAGFLLGTNSAGVPVYSADSLEVTPAGKINFGIQFGTLEYRTFRMPDLYTTPEDALAKTFSRSAVTRK